jgi:hypothetical protein
MPPKTNLCSPKEPPRKWGVGFKILANTCPVESWEWELLCCKGTAAPFFLS